MQQSLIGKQMLAKGKWDENGMMAVNMWWRNDGSEYGFPPQTELVACPHATLHGSWKWNGAWWGNFPKLFSSSI